MKSLALRPVFAIIVAFLATVAVSQSTARIVQMSLISGAVQIQLPDGHGWRPALLGAPVVEGEQVRTLASGRAEIQFENGSTLRLIPGSQLTVTDLRMSAKGVAETAAALQSGAMFASLRSTDDKDFLLQPAAGVTVTPRDDTNLRLDAGQVQVLGGHAEVVRDDARLELKGGQQTAFTGGAHLQAVALTDNKDPWTQWSHARDQYYEAAFQEGVQPGSLTNYVNWYDAPAAPTPDFSNTALLYTGAADCPWTVKSGDFAGYCWSSANGWYQSLTALTAAPVGVAPPVSQTVQPVGSDQLQNDPCMSGFMPSFMTIGFYGGPMLGGPPMGGPFLGSVGDPCIDPELYELSFGGWGNGWGGYSFYAPYMPVATGPGTTSNPIYNRHKIPGHPIHPVSARPKGVLAPPPARVAPPALHAGVSATRTAFAGEYRSPGYRTGGGSTFSPARSSGGARTVAVGSTSGLGINRGGNPGTGGGSGYHGMAPVGGAVGSASIGGGASGGGISSASRGGSGMSTGGGGAVSTGSVGASAGGAHVVH